MVNYLIIHIYVDKKYTCAKDADLLQENFLNAYEDAEQYLKRIGLEL